jgi:hypothetical protein
MTVRSVILAIMSPCISLVFISIKKYLRPLYKDSRLILLTAMDVQGSASGYDLFAGSVRQRGALPSTT